MVLASISGIGALLFAYGLFLLDPFMVSLGFVVSLLSKSWFLDRSVWLFEDMMHTSAEYRDWLYTDPSGRPKAR